MSSIHALVIDDNKENLDVMAQLLSREGVSCTNVFNPNQLSSALQSVGKVNVIFLDLEMPSLNGFEVLEILRADPSFDSTPIVAYSVHVSEMDTAYQHGFDGFLGKPLDSEKFPNQLARILGGEAVWETK